MSCTYLKYIKIFRVIVLNIGFHVAMVTFFFFFYEMAMVTLSVQPEPIITLFNFYEPTPEGKKTFYRQPRDIIKEREREIGES